MRIPVIPDQYYTFGSGVATTVSAFRSFALGKFRLSSSIEAAFEWSAQGKFNDTRQVLSGPDENSGGHALFLGGGAVLAWGDLFFVGSWHTPIRQNYASGAFRALSRMSVSLGHFWS